MFEKFLRVNAGDFRQRYAGTYGFYTRGGKKQLVKLTAVDTDHGEVLFTNVVGASFSLRWDADEDVGFEFVSPKSTWHNTKSGPFLVKRIAQRQYQRGISDANTGITKGGTSMQQVGASFDTLSAIFDNLVTIKEASKGRSFAISDQMLVGETKLWLFNQAIGSVERGKDYAVKLADPAMFLTEVTDAFRRAEIGATIV